MSAPAGDSEFAVKPIPTLIAKYSLAVMIGFTAAMLYGVIDSMFVSYFLGNQALAAVSASLPLATLTFVVPLTFSAGTATLTAIRLGEGRTDDANRILGQTVVWSALAGLSVALPCAVLLPEIFSLFGLEAGLLGQAVTFFRIALLGLPLMSVSIPLGC
ncbi:MAG: MATE family efflux transporter, partial [Negativicutes bacterium]|nr:MATE family efflux transporter [Negativicutes bacterium]